MKYVEVHWDNLRYYIREEVFKEKVNVHEIHFHAKLEEIADIVIAVQTNRFMKNNTPLTDYVKGAHGAPAIVIIK